MKVTSKNPSVSIIIVNWNGLEHLKICLSAVIKQTYDNYEVLIVDNGSSDSSVDFVKTKYPQIRVLELESNFGFDIGNIRGFERANGEYIVLLNNDTKPRENWLEEAVKVAESDIYIGIVGCVMLRWDSLVVDTAGDGCTWAGVGYKMYSGKKYSELPDKIDAFGACAGAALYKRTMIEDIGFLDEKFFMNLEDVDISYRARIHGYRIAIAKNSLVDHRVSASVSKMSALNTFYASRNIELVWWKNTPSSYLMRSLPDKIIHYMVALAFAFGSRERLKNLILGKMEAYRMIVHGKVKRTSKKNFSDGIFPVSEIKRMLLKARILHE